MTPRAVSEQLPEGFSAEQEKLLQIWADELLTIEQWNLSMPAQVLALFEARLKALNCFSAEAMSVIDFRIANFVGLKDKGAENRGTLMLRWLTIVSNYFYSYYRIQSTHGHWDFTFKKWLDLANSLVEKLEGKIHSSLVNTVHVRLLAGIFTDLKPESVSIEELNLYQKARINAGTILAKQRTGFKNQEMGLFSTALTLEAGVAHTADSAQGNLGGSHLVQKGRSLRKMMHESFLI